MKKVVDGHDEAFSSKPQAAGEEEVAQQDPSPGADKFFREQQRKSATTRTSFKLDHCLEKIHFCRILL